MRSTHTLDRATLLIPYWSRSRRVGSDVAEDAEVGEGDILAVDDKTGASDTVDTEVTVRPWPATAQFVATAWLPVVA